MKKKKAMYRIIGVILFALIILSIINITTLQKEYRDAKELYGEIREDNFIDDKKEENTNMEVDFDSLKLINKDVVGWIYVEGTNVNYPIVLGENNDYYLSYAFDNEKNKAGSIFMDYRNVGDFSERNNIIYGHQMKDGTMFTELNLYKIQEGYENHPNFFIYTPKKNYQVDVFAAYVADIEQGAWEVDFSNEEEYENWLQNTCEKSIIQTDIMPTAADRIVTLSTCSYEYNNARFIVVGILKDMPVEKIVQ